MTAVVERAGTTSRQAPSTGTPLVWIALIIGVAITLRVMRYAGTPSLWIDEARLALNLATRSWRALALPLDYDQTAPLGFLWLEKAAITIGGVGELALRAPVLLAGILSLPLIYALGLRLADSRVGIIATALAGFSPLLIQYSNEAKPYSWDLLTSLVLIHLALTWQDRPASPRAAWMIGAAGAVAVWISTPAVFVLAGITAVIAASRWDRRPPAAYIGATLVLWALSFAGVYAFIYRPVATNPYMQHYWAGSMLVPGQGFLARSWQGIRDLIWWLFFGGSTEPPLDPAENLTINVGAVAFLLLAVTGVNHLTRISRARVSLLLSPLVVVLGASLLGLYPVSARVLLFAAPALIVPVAAGAASFASRHAKSARGVPATALTLLLLAPPLHRDVVLALHPTMFEHVRAAVAEWTRRAEPGEAVYVSAAAIPAWTFYTTNWASPDRARLTRTARLAGSGGPAFENAPPHVPLPKPGETLAFPLGNAIEVLGRPNGAQWRSATGLEQAVPDQNWAALESGRIRAEAHPTIWLLISHSYGFERALYPELDRLGGRLEFSYGKDGVVLRRYRFP
jgi:hypothetical protein